MVDERTRKRCAFLRDGADPQLAVKYGQVGGTKTNVAGIPAGWANVRRLPNSPAVSVRVGPHEDAWPIWGEHGNPGLIGITQAPLI